jgi:hypothetical protein
MLNEDEVLIFLHIPKTAGSTFHTILGNQYKKSATKAVLGARYKDENIAQFISAPLEDKAHIKLFKGHMPFGLHEYIPAPCRYITFLRDPVERVISQYYYIKKNTHNPLHDAVEGGDMSIIDFVTSGIAVGMNNGQCRFINGDLDEFPFGENNRTLLDNAIINIEKYFELVGITERFDQSILLMSEALGWEKKPYYRRENVSKTKKTSREIDRNTIETIKSYNTLDIELYDFACNQMDSKASSISGFDDRLNNFIVNNSQDHTWLERLASAARKYKLLR